MILLIMLMIIIIIQVHRLSYLYGYQQGLAQAVRIIKETREK